MRSIAKQEKITKSPKKQVNNERTPKKYRGEYKNVIYTHTYARVYNIMEE